MTIQIKFLNQTAHKPARASRTAAGYDLAVPSDMEVTVIKPGESKLFGLGFATSFPPEMVALMFSRSGHGAKNGIRLANCVAVIDSDYRGEWKLALRNDSKEDFIVRGGDRIGQVVFMDYKQQYFDTVDELDATVRGTGGFGSTGSATENPGG